MSFFSTAIDLFLHLDKHLNTVIEQFGLWTYVFLFIIVFCETGLVVTPFLPGDSLLFAAGALAATGSFNIALLLIILLIAAIGGDFVNYQIGHYLGKKAYNKKNSKFIKKEYLDRTEKFYEKYGPMSIVLARFVPIIRTFAPFMAGVGTMSYRQFALYNIAGGTAWVTLFTIAGYLFGNLEFVKHNFTLVVIAIIFLSLLPPIYEFWKHKHEAKKKA
ncbi:MAG: DedA family protein [bacterium]